MEFGEARVFHVSTMTTTAPSMCFPTKALVGIVVVPR